MYFDFFFLILLAASDSGTEVAPEDAISFSLFTARLGRFPPTEYECGVQSVERGQHYVPRFLCSPVPMFPEPMFPGTYVPRYRCSPIFVNRKTVCNSNLTLTLTLTKTLNLNPKHNPNLLSYQGVGRISKRFMLMTTIKVKKPGNIGTGEHRYRGT